VFGVVGAATAVAATAVAAAAAGATVDWSDPELWGTIGGGAAWNVAFAALGVGLGALVPSLTGAVTGALAWIALVETVLGQLIGSTAAQWLPFTAGMALGRLPSAADALPQWGAAAVLAGYVAVLAAAAFTVTGRRDVA
jgi:ABC-2 type transport system permease protein